MAGDDRVIDGIDDVGPALRSFAGAPGTLVVPVQATVPAWLHEAVALARAADATVAVSLEPAEPQPDAEADAGWEIGATTAALLAGAAEVRGPAAQRVARVRTVLALLDQARSAPAPASASASASVDVVAEASS